ncbi:putative metalloprotease with PDZ domain [Sinorhizobium fredii]
MKPRSACGRVEAGEPADRAGLCEGDVVLPIARPS